MRLAFLLLLSATPVAAAERQVPLTTYDRVRVEGPIQVRLTIGAEPGGRVTGSPASLDTVELKVEGNTLIVRRTPRDRGERAFATADVALPAVEAGTRELRAASVMGGGALTLSGPVAGARIDLSVTGSGTIVAPRVAADALVATLIGEGTLTLGGSARSARLLANGGGAIAAADLTANDALVRTEGPVGVTLTVRYTVTASATGKGPITILGQPECKVRTGEFGNITCYRPTKF